MRTIRTKVYQFSELSKPAKQTAIESYRSIDNEHAWLEENAESMKSFAAIFPIQLKSWSYGGRGEGVNFSFLAEDTIEKLSGPRLATYIWNNYKAEIYSKKYYSMGKIGLTDKKIKHNRVISKQITHNCPNKGKYSNSYYSAITIEKYNCPLTGYCMDNDILDEIWKFLDKPDNRNFKDLLEDCFHAWVKACNADIEFQNSDQYITDEIMSNEYEFTKDGELFHK